MEPISGAIGVVTVTVGTIIVKPLVEGAAANLGHKCVDEHIDDIKRGINGTKDFISTEFDKGCQRDYEAGGITSWGQEPQAENA